jgi:hypothetical protein
MNEQIYGIYNGMHVPSEIVVQTGNKELDGRYLYFERGAGGIIFLNKDKILKVAHSINRFKTETEADKQKQAGKLASEIFYESMQILKSDKREKPNFNGETVLIIIMEYLDPEEWTPLREIEQFAAVDSSEIFDFTYELVFLKKLKNKLDYVGNTGSHLFRSMEDELKVIDFGNFETSTDHANDFMVMIKDIQDSVYITWPSPEDELCYEQIMDLETDITDEECKKYYLYEGREFLLNRLGIKPGSVTRSKKRKLTSGKKKKKKKKKKQTKKEKKKKQTKKSKKKKKQTKKSKKK